ncbi:NAD(P)/FAD-dependent oxidoreductase [Nocardioidaceae bacterium]|nr:NAD(P)/FAD-dependent oxidoreductase [Nocardioidaceae bacterium]
MSRVVVIGGGLAGCASAARLAKLGHEVVLLEQSPRLGGAIGTVVRPGFRWEAGPRTTLLPAVLRDLFRKSGRPLDRELELVPLDPPRRHRAVDGTWFELPTGNRSVQHQALAGTLGERSADAWLAWTASYAETWERLRDAWFEHVWDPDHVDPATRRLLTSRVVLDRATRGAFRDDRLRALALWSFAMDGQSARDVPAWCGLRDYLEQQLGVWTVPWSAGGFGALAGVLAARLEQRGVQVRLGEVVRDVEVVGGRAVGVRTDDEVVAGDHVVLCVDPRSMPATAPLVRRTSPVVPPFVVHLGLEGDVPDVPPQTVLHGDPLLVLTRGHAAGEDEGGDRRAWTVQARGAGTLEDVLRRLDELDLGVREQIVTTVVRSPVDQVRDLRGSAYGVQWQGRATLRHRLVTRTPVPGLLAAGAHAGPGSATPFVGLGAALVAQEIGRA